MERPKTKLEDYYEFRARRDAVERSMVGREVLDTDPKVKNALSEIEKNFKGKINYSDNFEFDTIEEMRQFLLGYKNEHGLAETQIDDMVAHELEHAEVAKRQGHKCSFGVWILDAGEGKIGWAPYLRVSFDQIITEDNRREIAEAPTNKSELDY